MQNARPECSCAVPELPIDAERMCSRCEGFIPFDGMAECMAWVQSLQSLSMRCRICWRGALRCTCETIRYVRDTLPVDNEPRAKQASDAA